MTTRPFAAPKSLNLHLLPVRYANNARQMTEFVPTDCLYNKGKGIDFVRKGHIMKTLLYVVTFLGGILGIFILFSTVLADSAPQQGAGAAVAMAFVVIPYCMARVIGESHKERLLEELAKATKPQATPPQPTAHTPPRNLLVPKRT